VISDTDGSGVLRFLALSAFCVLFHERARFCINFVSGINYSRWVGIPALNLGVFRNLGRPFPVTLAPGFSQQTASLLPGLPRCPGTPREGLIFCTESGPR